MENLIMILAQMDGFGPGKMWFMPVICIAICVVLFLFFRKSGMGPFSHRSGRMDRTDNGNSSAIDILNSRYAKGEISKEEYDRMKKDIS